MSNLLVHDMDTIWTSSDAAVLQVTVDNQTFSGEGMSSNRLVAVSGALNASSEFIPLSPLNLTSFEELRFWIQSNRRANGSSIEPFYLEFSYVDANDTPGEEHRWFVPINQVGRWEQRRIGIQNDRRSAISRMRFRCLVDSPFACNIDELLAVHEEMLIDLEEALEFHLGREIALLGVANVALQQTANPGDTQIILPLTPGFHIGNRILIQGGSAGNEIHDVIGADHDPGMTTTTLHFGAGNNVVGTLTAAVATVSVVVPVFVEMPPQPNPTTTPAIVLTRLDAREDFDRTGYFTQRDSFRPRGSVIVCSVRPAPRAYLVDYQITVVAPERAQQLFIHTLLLSRLTMDAALRINGAPSPAWTLPPPVLDRRELGLLAPTYVRIGTRLETAPRREQTWIQQAEIDAGRIDAPLDLEGIVLEL